MKVSPKKMIERLGASARAALEAAIAEGNELGVPEIGPAFVVHALLSDRTCGASRLFEAMGLATDEFREHLHQRVTATATEPGARPGFSSGLFRWFEDTWLFVSVELDERELQTTHLVWSLLTRPERYESIDLEIPEELSAELLRGELTSVRDPATTPAPAPSAPLQSRVHEVEQRLASVEHAMSTTIDMLEQRIMTLEAASPAAGSALTVATIRQRIIDAAGAGDDYDADEDALSSLVDELQEAGPTLEHAIGIVDGIAGADPLAHFGSPGPLVHFIETISGFETILLETADDLPRMHFVWMLGRVVNSGGANGERALEILRLYARDLDAPAALRAEVSSFLATAG